MKINPSEWRWFGHAGHLAVRRWCRFHLCTGVGLYLISTVGDYVPPEKPNRYGTQGEDIGSDYKYETQVWKAGPSCNVLLCHCGLPSLDGEGLEMLTANMAGEAAHNHMMLCKKYAELG